MRLIDADELRKNMFDYAPPEMEWDRGDIEHKIGEMPTIDAIPVVRCKDCVYARQFNAIWQLPKRDTLICTIDLLNDGSEVTKNDFCSFGRINETN